MAYDYKASLKAWMTQHMLSPLDVRNILNEMCEDDRVLPFTLVCSNGITSLAEDEANRTADGANWMFPSTGSNSLSDVDDSMDGDFDSAMASAGHGTDEDYGYFGDPEICGE